MAWLRDTRGGNLRHYFHGDDRRWRLEFWFVFWPDCCRHYHGDLDGFTHPLVATTRFAFAPHVVHAGGRSYIQPRSRYYAVGALACGVCLLFCSSHLDLDG